MNELFCMCISYLCPVNMHNYYAIYVLIYYSWIRVKNLNFGLKNIHCVLLLCITDVYYYYAFWVLCIIRGVPRIWQGGGKNFFSDLENCMSRSDMLRMAKPCALLGGFGGMSPEKIFLNGEIWCVLEYILIRFCL